MRIIDQSTYNIPDNIQKILLIQLGDIGDVVWTTPSIRAAKNAFPNGEISILVKEGFGGLLEADPSVDRIFEVKSYAGNFLRRAINQLSFLRNIRSQHFDLAIDLRLGDRGAFLSRATGAPIRATLYHPTGLPWWRNLLFTHGVIPADLPPERGAAEQSLRILRVLGIDTDNKIPHLWVSESVMKSIMEILRQENMAGLKRWITINPFSRWSYKEWDDHKWAEIISGLWNDFGIRAVVVGSTEERTRAEDLIQKCNSGVMNLAGKTTLAELACLLGLSRLHIGVDSAAPHIAAAIGTPTVTIYGPSSWFDWAPVGVSHCVIAPEMTCAPCHQKGCGGSGRSECLQNLTVKQVKDIVWGAVKAQAVQDGTC